MSWCWQFTQAVTEVILPFNNFIYLYDFKFKRRKSVINLGFQNTHAFEAWQSWLMKTFGINSIQVILWMIMYSLYLYFFSIYESNQSLTNLTYNYISIYDKGKSIMRMLMIAWFFNNLSALIILSSSQMLIMKTVFSTLLSVILTPVHYRFISFLKVTNIVQRSTSNTVHYKSEASIVWSSS